MAELSTYDLIKEQNGEEFANTLKNYNDKIFDIPNIVNIVKYAGSDADPQIIEFLETVFLSKKTKQNEEEEDSLSFLKKMGEDYIKNKQKKFGKYIIISDNHIVKYTQEIDGYYFGDGYFVKNRELTEIKKDSEVMIDQYVLDLKDKTVKNIIEESYNDNFFYTQRYRHTAKTLNKEIENKKIQISKNEDGTKSILLDGKEFARLKNSNLLKLNIEDAKEISDGFLEYSPYLTDINIPNAITIGSEVLANSENLENINIEKCGYIGDDFLRKNKKLKNIDIPNAREIGEGFLFNNKQLEYINCPNLKSVGDYFLYNNEKLNKIELSNVKKINLDNKRQSALIQKLFYKQEEQSDILKQETIKSGLISRD